MKRSVLGLRGESSRLRKNPSRRDARVFSPISALQYPIGIFGGAVKIALPLQQDCLLECNPTDWCENQSPLM
jgi:hypothetical protein